MYSYLHVVYHNTFSVDIRNILVNKWCQKLLERKIPCSSNFDIASIMSTPIEIKNWNISGLPTDNVIISSAILVTKSKRYPLIIDPQEQA